MSDHHGAKRTASEADASDHPASNGAAHGHDHHNHNHKHARPATATATTAADVAQARKLLKLASDDASESQAVKNFREFLRIKTVHPNPDYDTALHFLRRMAGELHLPFETIEVAPGKVIAIMSWIGTSPELPSIMLNAHTDVVPVFEEFWTHGPFDATKLENGDIIGRGTQDMKCVAIQYIEAVRNLIAQGVRLARTLHLTFVPDEEIGGHSGMELFVDHERFKALNIGFALDEGLANETDAFTVYYGERAPWWVRVKAVGRPGHGSRFVENTATEKLMRVIEKFLAFRQQQKSLLESGEAKTLGDVTTLNLTMLEGGVQFNIVPAEASAGFDIRIPPTVDLVEFEKQLGVWTSSEEGVTFEFVSKFENNQMTVLDDNNVWWKAFKTACDAQALTLVTEIFPAATDSRYIRQKSIPALGFSPINNTPILLHDHNEFLNEAVFVRGVTVYEHVLKSIGNVPPQ